MSIPLIDEIASLYRQIGELNERLDAYEGTSSETGIRNTIAECEEKLDFAHATLGIQFHRLRMALVDAQRNLEPGNYGLQRELRASERWLDGETRKISVRGIE